MSCPLVNQSLFCIFWQETSSEEKKDLENYDTNPFALKVMRVIYLEDILNCAFVCVCVCGCVLLAGWRCHIFFSPWGLNYEEEGFSIRGEAWMCISWEELLCSVSNRAVMWADEQCWPVCSALSQRDHFFQQEGKERWLRVSNNIPTLCELLRWLWEKSFVKARVAAKRDC